LFVVAVAFLKMLLCHSICKTCSYRIWKEINVW